MRELIADEAAVDPAARAGSSEVVRCGSCRWFRVGAGGRFTFCEWWHRKVPRHGFCHVGERREAER